MSESVYGELLRIKKFREQSAANEVARRTRAVEECTQAIEAAKQEVARYHDYRLRHERELFEEIRGREVGLDDVQGMRSAVAAMREEEVHKKELVIEAEKRLAEARQALEQARQQHLVAVREQEKFEQLLEHQREVEAREEVLAEDNEIEEIVSAGWKPGRGDS